VHLVGPTYYDARPIKTCDLLRLKESADPLLPPSVPLCDVKKTYSEFLHLLHRITQMFPKRGAIFYHTAPRHFSEDNVHVLSIRTVLFVHPSGSTPLLKALISSVYVSVICQPLRMEFLLLFIISFQQLVCATKALRCVTFTFSRNCHLSCCC
jgi:hypothetical protein